jgi:hypothetical protein
VDTLSACFTDYNTFLSMISSIQPGISRSRIHERIISLRFLRIIWRVLRLPDKPLLLGGGGGEGSKIR